MAHAVLPMGLRFSGYLGNQEKYLEDGWTCWEIHMQTNLLTDLLGPRQHQHQPVSYQ